MYTYKIEQAIQAAAVLHQEHRCKGTVPIPFITHLMAVTFILRDYTGDEDTLVAALLHDTLEGTDYTVEEMNKDFGDTVTDIVTTLTVVQTPDERSLSWLERKQAYAKQLKAGPVSAVQIAAADAIHTFRAVVEDYHDQHNQFLQEFGTNIRDRLDGFQLLANVVNVRLDDGIVHEFNHTYELYKQFLTDVQETKQG